jgi:hemerythrin-like domain-containing protein
MKPTEELIHEHEAIQTMLRILESASSRLVAGEQVSADDLANMVEFLRVFADRCHHAKEETVLFPAMEAVGIPRERGPIGVMLSEHDAGRKHIQGMAAALESYRSGAVGAAREFATQARLYTHLLLQHIQKENQILFPMADAHIAEREQERIAQEFARLEAEQIGEGTHERFHALLGELKQAYLSSEPSPVKDAL